MVNPLQIDVLYNVMDSRFCLQDKDNKPYCGAREKSPAFIETLVETCSPLGGRVLDLTTGTGRCCHEPQKDLDYSRKF